MLAKWISSKGAIEASPEDGHWWCQYVNSLLVRHPTYLLDLKASAPGRLEDYFRSMEADFQARKGDTADESLVELARRTSPARIENAGLEAIQLQAREGQMPRAIHDMEWQVRPLSDDHDLLLADKPVLFGRTYPDRQPLLLLPLSPRCLFGACDDLSVLSEFFSLPDRDIIRMANIKSCQQAVNFVWGAAEADFVDRLFRPPAGRGERPLT